MIYYSHENNGFYNSAIHGSNIPADAREITSAEHAQLLQEQSQGKVISVDELGRPIAIERPITPADLIKSAKAERDNGQYEPITVAGVTYDANELGQRNIESAIDNFELLDAALRGDGTLDWTLENNTTKIVTKQQLIAVKNAVVLRYAGLHAAYTAFKNAQTPPPL